MRETATAMPAVAGEIARTFLKLGCTSFGGPVAHLGYFHEEFVVRRRWLDDAEYADLVALCQFLPGPASSQVVFALGMRRGGLAGAMLASLCFTLPSAALMIAFAYGVVALGEHPARAGALHGLKLAAVAVVAQAVLGMGKKLCPDAPRVLLALFAAAIVVATPGPFAPTLAIALGALAGYVIFRRIQAVPTARSEAGLARHHLAAAASLALFAALLVVLPGMAASSGAWWAKLIDGFYRAGALVFGGGHVVLPLLRAEVVTSGLLSDSSFLAGYGAAQAVPGPLFTFAAYLGAAIRGGGNAWFGGLLGLCAIFLPAWLLIGGALPFWHTLRSKIWIQAALRGANAAVVGVLAAALWDPVIREGVATPVDAVVATTAILALEFGQLPAWTVVAACALFGAAM